MVVHNWSETEFWIEDPDPYPITNGGQTRHARGPVHAQFRYIYTPICTLQHALSVSAHNVIRKKVT